MPAVRRALADGRTVLGGFRTKIMLHGKRLEFMTTHQFIKTYYIAALLRPLSFVRRALPAAGSLLVPCLERLGSPFGGLRVWLVHGSLHLV